MRREIASGPRVRGKQSADHTYISVVRLAIPFGREICDTVAADVGDCHTNPWALGRVISINKSTKATHFCLKNH